MSTNLTAPEIAQQTADHARTLGARGVIVIVSIGDEAISSWQTEYRGPAFDLEALARRLHSFCARLIRGAEAQANQHLNGPMDTAANTSNVVGGGGASP